MTPVPCDKGSSAFPTQHPFPIGSFITGSGGSHEQIASPDGAVFCRIVTEYDPDDGQRNFIVWC
jgi:hypothetical protein